MVFSQSIDYEKFCFQHEVLPKIIGAPSFGRLKDLKKIVRASAASVQSELGGGAHGHLGIADDEYSFLN